MSQLAIPPDLEAVVLALAGEGHTTREISALLRERHQVEASHVAVARLLKKHRELRGEVTRTIVQEKLSRTVLSDLDRLEELRTKVRARLETTEADRDFAALANAESKILVAKLHYAGAGQPQQDQASVGIRVYLPPEEPLVDDEGEAERE